MHITEWTLTSGAAPVQAEGRLSDGREFYFRARHSRVWFGAGRTEAECVQEHGIEFQVIGWDADPHLLSGIDPAAARQLADAMCSILADAEEHAQRPPYAWAWNDAG